MGIFDLFSKRQRRARGDVPDVYRYDDLPRPLRVQIIHVVNDALGEGEYREAWEAYEAIKNALCRERGVFNLPSDTSRLDPTPQEEAFN